METNKRRDVRQPALDVHSRNVVSQKDWYQSEYHNAATAGFISENPFAENFLDLVLEGRTVNVCLEIGAGAGILTERLLSRNMKVVGIELAQEGVNAMRVRFQREIASGQLVPVCADAIEFLEKTDLMFDLIVGAGVLHHITPDTHSRLFSLAYRRLAPTGQLAFGPEPSTDGLFYLYWRYLVPHLYKLLGMSYEWAVECGATSIRRARLKRLLTEAGYVAVAIRPYQHFPAWRSKLLKRLGLYLLKSRVPWAIHVMVLARK